MCEVFTSIRLVLLPCETTVSRHTIYIYAAQASEFSENLARAWKVGLVILHQKKTRKRKVRVGLQSHVHMPS